MFALCAVTTLDIPLTYNGDTQSILDTGIPWRSRGLTEACFWVLKKGRVGHRDLVSQWQRQFAYTLRLLKNGKMFSSPKDELLTDVDAVQHIV
ncbi:hypothetical protein T4B_6759 [Trichinella pseudospiralis]|uniref:Uncharacterized protein n=2 Tax=Trichinella pseudospiralis TaxID=6337 RepID=A0A0V1FDP5_TRIPS|nr:hypothetical protein T4E_2385 [Trichinella pseudospiralis]KRY67794.1 hypothetical protein T4A_2362 [Trichinella pseudospiralis]KRY84092.1 hypothetical protein T4D_3092 [Trichinella pseudospiralis]KRZ24045.1 hypothetical protein T4B_6759 [Trichinella pseudospiralis]